MRRGLPSEHEICVEGHRAGPFRGQRRVRRQAIVRLTAVRLSAEVGVDRLFVAKG
jgi:hypothetical protein